MSIKLTVSKKELENLIGCVNCYVGEHESPFDPCTGEKALLEKLKARRGA